MMTRFLTLGLIVACLSSLSPRSQADEQADETIDFDRQIKPILAENCFACHGIHEQARQADLRLDVRQSAVEAGAIVPGAPNESTLIERINSDDPNSVMPPPESHKSLTQAQRKLLVDWIAAGAEYPSTLVVGCSVQAKAS